MGIRTLAHFSPGRLILSSVFFTILVGTLLLALPIAHTGSLSFLDLFFTATSATCVTGLFTIPISSFTLFGKCILLLLIQIGGLGLITLTLFMMSLFMDMGLATSLIAGKILELESWHTIKNFIVFIIILTLGIEFLGALLIFPILYTKFPLAKAVFFSLFHSVASFCNAGISLFDIQLFSSNYAFLLITSALIICGGLGFITWHELLRYAQAKASKKRFTFSLHSKIILYGTITLLFISSIVFWILEHNNVLGHMSPLQILTNTFFQASNMRSAGFFSVNIHELQLATLFFTMIMAFIGTASCSTGSGIKITTLAVFLATIKSAISGRQYVEIRGRTIARDQVYKATAIISISIAWIAMTTLCLLITEPLGDFMDLFIETISAFTNLGVSMGITPLLSTIGKLFIIMSMIVGRIGSLTLILAFKLKMKPEPSGFSYPEERVMLS